MNALVTGIKRAGSDFIEDDCMSSGAAIAYYSIFSIPPLLVMVMTMASWAGASPERVDQLAREQLGIPADAAGAEGGEEAGLAQTADRAQSSRFGEGGTMSWIVGIGLLLFSATGLFAQLQYSLNRAWEVEPDPEQGGVMRFVLKRVFSFGMIVVIAFLLLVSMILTTFVDEIIEYVRGGTPGTVATVISFIADHLITLAIATLLFAAMFKILPDAKMAMRDIWVGAAITALLFVIGKALISWYLQNSDMGMGWGSAAASMIGLLVWVYYSSLIVLFGAEVTQVWANAYGRGMEPADGAVRTVQEKRPVRDGESTAKQQRKATG